ncbi:MAG: hypothetical protein H6Q84_874 [Deltaproteobacteria bacterium]|nr:hypothetical protein [Deltaproteobacteria bacterium]
MNSFRTIGVLSGVRLSAAVLVAVLALAGCATGRVPFTQTLREQYGLEGDDLKKVQYFLSGDITLQREFRREEGEISNTHKLVIKEGGYFEEVFIASGTPGVATEVGPASIAVSFEPGGSLVFGSPATDRDSDRKYKLSAKRWTDYYGELVYEDKTWYAVKGSGQAFLEVGAESLDAVEKKRKVLPGMTLPPK